MNENNTAQRVVAVLKERGLRVSAAESCTGGLVAASLVAVPDASRVLDASFVTYANWAKTAYAHVPEELLRSFGEVSGQVAGAMADGVRKTTGAHIGLSTTGIAGPGGGTEEKPVGLVWFGISVDGVTRTFCRHFENMDRNEVRAAAAETILSELLADMEGQEAKN